LTTETVKPGGNVPQTVYVAGAVANSAKYRTPICPSVIVTVTAAGGGQVGGTTTVLEEQAVRAARTNGRKRFIAEKSALRN
jgi:protein involved in polysaccharide export with SLBB domain